MNTSASLMFCSTRMIERQLLRSCFRTVATSATIWGANPYESGSDICRSAVHAGAISTSGGEVKVTSATKVPVFPSVTRNGVRSASSGPGDGYTVASASGLAMAVATTFNTGGPWRAGRIRGQVRRN